MKTTKPLAATLAALMITSCAPSSGAEGPAPGGLGYSVPDPNPATYAFSDTTRFSIEAGPMGTMEVIGAQSGVAEMDFRETEDGLIVVTGLLEYSGHFGNPAQGAVTADEQDMTGPLVISLDRSGMIAVVDTPVLSQRMLEITGPEALVRPLFVHLPRAPVQPGESWVDTVDTREESLSTVSTGRTVIHSTLVGDTVIGEREALLITTRSDNRVEVTGESGGVEILQRLEGGTSGLVIWDPRRRVLVERHEAGELEGTLEMPGLDVTAIPVSATVRRSVRLRPPEPSPAEPASPRPS